MKQSHKTTMNIVFKKYICNVTHIFFEGEKNRQKGELYKISSNGRGMVKNAQEPVIAFWLNQNLS